MSQLQENHIQALIFAAREAQANAYAPYSNFRVGAAVLTTSGKVYLGCNIENASYGLTVCAERVAIQKAVSEGHNQITAVAIVAGEDVVSRPCGACLQVMQEFAVNRDMPVITALIDGDAHDVRPLSHYLPMPFEL